MVGALQRNTKLTALDLRENDGISDQGLMMSLKLVNDISSINAALQSNHTLMHVRVKEIKPVEYELDQDGEIQTQVDMAKGINRSYENRPEAADRETLILTQFCIAKPGRS